MNAILFKLGNLINSRLIVSSVHVESNSSDEHTRPHESTKCTAKGPDPVLKNGCKTTGHENCWSTQPSCYDFQRNFAQRDVQPKSCEVQ